MRNIVFIIVVTLIALLGIKGIFISFRGLLKDKSFIWFISLIISLIIVYICFDLIYNLLLSM